MGMSKELLLGLLSGVETGKIGWDVNGGIGQMLEELRAGVDKLEPAQEFEIGAVVKPKKHANIKGCGKPWRVLAKTGLIYVIYEASKPIHLCDIIVGVMVEGELLRFHNFSGDYELFDKDKVEF